MPCRVPSGRATSRLPCLNRLRLALPRQPRRSLPCQTLPRHVARAEPASPRPAPPRHARPGRACRVWPQTHRAKSRLAPPRQAWTALPRRSKPCLVAPSLPCPASPRPAMPGLARTRRARTRRARPHLDCLAQHRRAWPSLPMSGPALSVLLSTPLPPRRCSAVR